MTVEGDEVGDRRLTFGSLFSGCGGFDLGFIERGHECLFAFDIDPDAVQNYTNNIGSHISRRDLTEPLPTDLTVPDVVISGPPCQGFSLAGRRDLDDPRNHLLVLAAEHSVAIAPSVIMIENVRGALSGSHREYWDKATLILKQAGYVVRAYELEAFHYGLPQRRRRVVLVGSKVGTPPDLTESPPKRLSDVLKCTEENSNHQPLEIPKDSDHFAVASSIKQGQKLCNVRRGDASIHTWSIPEAFGETSDAEKCLLEQLVLLRRRLRTRQTGDADPVPVGAVAHLASPAMIESLVDRGHLRRIGDCIDLTHTFNGKYRRLCVDGLAPTVDTRYGDFRYFLHPTEHRGLTVREAARIQGFPDSYEFSGTMPAQYRLIGNAVPPPMAASLAEACEQLLSGRGGLAVVHVIDRTSKSGIEST